MSPMTPISSHCHTKPRYPPLPGVSRTVTAPSGAVRATRSATGSPSATLHRSVSNRPRTILVIDADEAARERMSDALRRDYRVVRAASGEAALTLLTREEVDVALLGVALPGISGFEVLPILRENYPATEVIMVSA